MTDDANTWADRDTKPQRPGIYERSLGVSGGSGFAYFDGDNWRAMAGIAEKVDRSAPVSPSQNLPWRGLAQDPEAKG